MHTHHLSQYAMRLTPRVAAVLDEPLLASLRARSGCALSVAADSLYGVQETFLVFVRGDSGQPSNAAMAAAVDLWSQLLQTEERLQVRPCVAPDVALCGPPSEPYLMVERLCLPPQDAILLATEEGADAEAAASAADTAAAAEGDAAAAAEAAATGKAPPTGIKRVLDLPAAAVALVAGKGGKKLYAMRKKSGAYVALVSSKKDGAKLFIAGNILSVEVALGLVKAALAGYAVDG